MRAAALAAVGGYRDELIAGEEPELCVRLRASGWSIWRIDEEMTLHDAAITRFRQWWLADGSQRPRVCRGEPSPQVCAGAALDMGKPPRVDMGSTASAGMCGSGSVVRTGRVRRVADLSAATVAQDSAPVRNIAHPIQIRFF